MRLFGFDRGAVVEFGMEALIVPPPHPLQRREFDLRGGALRPAGADQLGLEESINGLGHRIIVRITDGPG